MSSTGLKFTHSPSIDPLRRHCSAVTIQSDPKVHFCTLIDHLRKQENYENVLLQVNQHSHNNLELVKYVSQLEAMALFVPQSFYKNKDEELATKERLVGNEAFKKGNFIDAFKHYSFSIMKAVYPGSTNNTGEQVIYQNCYMLEMAFIITIAEMFCNQCTIFDSKNQCFFIVYLGIILGKSLCLFVQNG